MYIFSHFIELVFPSSNVERALKKAVASGILPTARPHMLSWVSSVFDYRHKLVRKSIRILKTRRSNAILQAFGRALCSYLTEELSDAFIFSGFKDPVVIPIPVTPQRRRERGFNQAELIARELQTHPLVRGIETKVLVKIHNTKKQATIKNKNERMQNIRGSFATQNHVRIQGRCVLLIDDVTTTGATLHEARRLLIKAGAAQVIAITVAH